MYEQQGWEWKPSPPTPPPRLPTPPPPQLIYKLIEGLIMNLKRPLVPWYDGISRGYQEDCWDIHPEAPEADEERIRQTFLEFHEMRTVNHPIGYSRRALWAENPLPLEEDIDKSLDELFAKRGLARPSKSFHPPISASAERHLHKVLDGSIRKHQARRDQRQRPSLLARKSN